MTPHPSWTLLFVLLLTLGVVNPIVGSPSTAGAIGRSDGSFSQGTGLPGHLPDDHIQHVITVMMENHDYDSYFATYCQVLGPYCSSVGNGIPSNTCVPYYPTAPSYGCVVPFNFTPAQFTISDMAHDSYSGATALDGGAMDGFYSAEGTPLAFGHYNQTTVPIYWDMAEQYAMGDNFWGGNLSWSLPNHWYLIAGASPADANQNFTGWYGWDPTYLNEANKTPAIEDLLNRTNVTWRYYDYALMSSYSSAISSGGVWDTAYDYWNPMGARAVSYTSPYANHFVPRSRLLTDLSGGKLPNVSWVIPDFTYTDHPGWNNSYGEGWFAQLVDAVANSTYWNSTVIFLTWDDYGGFYDHVAPPKILGNVLSFRAPLLVISPYAKENYISHVQTDFMSLLRFVEWQFGLGCLTPYDCLATLPLDFFDFNQTARPPILFPTWWQNATYPMPLQKAAAINRACGTCLRPVLPQWGNDTIGLPPPRDPD